MLSVLSLLETLVTALILAFVLRGFVVEAFVIPTGSMAQSLMGAHTETICPNCRFEYPTGVGQQVQSNLLVCPNCHDKSAKLSDDSAVPRSGDRVLALKPMYFLSRYKWFEWMGPKRWDSVVFLYPGSGQDNYIKRLTGLPGERIEIAGGDVYINGAIARKTAKAQASLWISVFDNDHQRSRDLQGWPRWQESRGRQIERPQGGRVLRIKAKGEGKEIIYKGPINNVLGYNALTPSSRRNTLVNDLRLSFDVIPAELGPDAEVTAVLRKWDRFFRVRLAISEAGAYLELQHGYRPAEAKAILWRDLLDDAGSSLRYNLTDFSIGQSVNLTLQNVDYQVSVLLDGREVLASTDSNYPAPGPKQARALAASREPKQYVAIAAKDCEVDLLHIKLQRDVYYTSDMRILVPPKEQMSDPGAADLDGASAHAVAQAFSIPPTPGSSEAAYFMLGDNSSYSQDSRLWWDKHKGLGEDYVRGTVPRSHMIGQAFFVYWPAGGPIFDHRLPYIPRIGKMRLIH